MARGHAQEQAARLVVVVNRAGRAAAALRVVRVEVADVDGAGVLDRAATYRLLRRIDRRGEQAARFDVDLTAAVAARAAARGQERSANRTGTGRRQRPPACQAILKSWSPTAFAHVTLPCLTAT